MKRGKYITILLAALITVQCIYLLAPIKVSAVDYIIPSEFGDKVGSSFTLSGKTYQNYQRGYIEQSGGTITNAVASKNISSNGAVSWANADLMVDMVGDPMDLTNVSASTVTAVQNALKQEYRNLYNGHYNVGIRCSTVSLWDGFIHQEFRFGDSTVTMWDRNIHMTALIYNPTANAAYRLRDQFLSTFDGNKSTLGCPVADDQTLTLTLPGQSKASTVRIQFFMEGFIYLNGSTPEIITGYNYVNGKFVKVPAAKIPSAYGNLVTRFSPDNNKTIYFNYQYGCEKAVMDSTGNYTTAIYSGRNFTSGGKLYMLSVNLFTQNIGNLILGNFTDAQKASIKNKMVSEYNSLFKSGFFPGFANGEGVTTWNNCVSLQFFWGDSSACPWASSGDSRVNVSAFIYNVNKGSVTLLKDGPLEIWNESQNYETFGAPVSDEAVAKNGDVYQTYQNGLLVLVGGSKYIYLFEPNMSYEQYVKINKSFNVPTHHNNVQDGYIGGDMVVTNTITNMIPVAGADTAQITASPQTAASSSVSSESSSLASSEQSKTSSVSPVSNEPTQKKANGLIFLIVAAIVVVAAGVTAGVLFLKKKKSPPET